MKHLAATAGLLLLVQAFHLAQLQYSTDSPRRTIDKSWLRELAKNTAESENTAFTAEESEYDQGINASDLKNDDSNGIPSGSMAAQTEEEENVARQDDSKNVMFDEQTADPTMLTMFESDTPKQPELADSPDFTNSTQTNMTEPEDEFNSAMTADNTTSFENSLNNMDHQSESNATEEFTAPRDTDTGLKNSTGSSNATSSTGSSEVTNSTGSSDATSSMGFSDATNSTESSDATSSTGSSEATNSTGSSEASNSTGSSDATNSTGSSDATNSTGSSNTTNSTGSSEATNSTGSSNTTNSMGPSTTTTVTAEPEINEIPTTRSTNPFENSETTTVTAAIPERANKTGKGVNNSDRGVETDTYRSKRSVAWVAVLGTAAAVACVGLVAYILKKKRSGFSHRKLVEEYPSDPVLRLDNSEPLDLNFAGSGAYYNPGLQGDNIQMTSFPGHR